METNFSYSNISNSDISFTFNKKEVENLSNGIKFKEFSKNKELKGKLPKNKIFRINSLISNIEKKTNEIYFQYNCIYNEKDNSLCLIINANDNYSKFTKVWLINILHFSISIGVESICLLVSKSNKKYLKVIQDMIIVGFKIDEKCQKITIDGIIYKILKMPIKDIYQEIREISLI